jgi:hypothetical protein
MTREAFIDKWIGNPEKPNIPENRDEMRYDLDRVIETSRFLQLLRSYITVYEFVYRDSFKSGPMTISIHRTEEGAIKAMEDHRRKVRKKWEKIQKKYPEEDPYPWDFDQSWAVIQSKLLP